MGAFRTDWDTAANPRYDVWTTTNGGEVIPGVLSPVSYTHLTLPTLYPVSLSVVAVSFKKKTKHRIK